MAKGKDQFTLSDTQYQQIKRLQGQVKATLEYLTKCENCRYDVKDELEKTRDQLESLSKTLQEFGPKP
jgi:chromosome segregation ATPase